MDAGWAFQGGPVKNNLFETDSVKLGKGAATGFEYQ
jgi:hypothetical protein